MLNHHLVELRRNLFILSSSSDSAATADHKTALEITKEQIQLRVLRPSTSALCSLAAQALRGSWRACRPQDASEHADPLRSRKSSAPIPRGEYGSL
jgi:hypothetical protein